MTNKMSKEDFMKKIAEETAKKNTVILLDKDGKPLTEVKKDLDLTNTHKLSREGLDMKAKPAEDKKKTSSIAKVKNQKAKKKETYRDTVYAFLEPFINETEGLKVQKVKEGLAYQNKEGEWIVVRVVIKKEMPEGYKEE